MGHTSQQTSGYSTEAIPPASLQVTGAAAAAVGAAVTKIASAVGEGVTAAARGVASGESAADSGAALESPPIPAIFVVVASEINGNGRL